MIGIIVVYQVSTEKPEPKKSTFDQIKEMYSAIIKKEGTEAAHNYWDKLCKENPSVADVATEVQLKKAFCDEFLS